MGRVTRELTVQQRDYLRLFDQLLYVEHKDEHRRLRMRMRDQTVQIRVEGRTLNELTLPEGKPVA